MGYKEKDFQERLKTIEARFNEATVGLWKQGHKFEVLRGPNSLAVFKREADAAFCAHAHQDVYWLLEQVKRLQIERDSILVDLNTYEGLRDFIEGAQFIV